MTTQEAIAKAKNIDLAKELGVPIVPPVKLGRHLFISEYGGDWSFDREGTGADEFADMILSILVKLGKQAIEEARIAQLKVAELRWIEPDPLSSRGYYKLYLATEQ